MQILSFNARTLATRFGAIAALALLGVADPASASGDGFSNVSVMVSGVPNLWLLDFTVIPTNSSNMADKSYISTFKIGAEGGTAFASPPGYVSTLVGGETEWQGTKDAMPSLKESAPTGVSGFETLATSVAAPLDVSWTVVLASGSFESDFYVHGEYQAKVSDAGIAGAVPEVGTLQLMLLGLAAIVASMWIRRREPRRFERTWGVRL